MEINNTEQLLTFLNGILIGCYLGAIFDIFRILRITIHCNKVIVIIQDFIFSLIIGFVSMVYIVFYGDGYIRFYIILAEIIGFTIYNYTISKIVINLYSWFLFKVKRIFKVISIKLIRPIVLVFIALFKQITRCFNKVDIKFRKIHRINKFNLKYKRLMLYNLFISSGIGVKWKKNEKKLIKKKTKNKKDKG